MSRSCGEDQRQRLRSRRAVRAPIYRTLATMLTHGRRFKTMEAASLRLQKEAKGYLDSLRGTCRPTPAAIFLRSSNIRQWLTRSSNDGLADAHRRDDRRLLRRRGRQGRREQELQAGRRGSGRRDNQGAGWAVQVCIGLLISRGEGLLTRVELRCWSPLTGSARTLATSTNVSSPRFPLSLLARPTRSNLPY